MADSVHPISLLSQAHLPTRFGDFDVAVFEIDGTPGEAVALMQGPLGGNTIPLVRLHSECLTGDVLGSLRCDCGEQLAEALALIASADSGVTTRATVRFHRKRVSVPSSVPSDGSTTSRSF